jgi:hypothetical protein
MILKFITRLLRVIMLVALVVVLVYVTTSNGVDYVHTLGKTCLLAHHGWQMHVQCGVTSPLN